MKAFSPNEVRKAVATSFDKPKLVKQLNQILVDSHEKMKTGIYISTSALEADENTLRELLPDWHVTSDSDRDGSFWIIKAK